MTPFYLWIAPNVLYLSLAPMVFIYDMPITYEPICYSAAIIIAATYQIFKQRYKDASK